MELVEKQRQRVRKGNRLFERLQGVSFCYAGRACFSTISYTSLDFLSRFLSRKNESATPAQGSPLQWKIATPTE